MVTLSESFQMSEGQRHHDDLLLLRREVQEWQHLDIAVDERLLKALQRWPLLAQCEWTEPDPALQQPVAGAEQVMA